MTPSKPAHRNIRKDDRYRSLLQKAVRRGNVDLIFTASALLKKTGLQTKSWYDNQTAIITFEECWPLGSELQLKKTFHSKVATLIRAACSQKARAATGLGYLAYSLAEGDPTVLDATAGDKIVKIIANAVQRPESFWDWVASQSVSDRQRQLIRNAKHYKNAGSPRDRTVVQAAAYLAATGEIPVLDNPGSTDQNFPYWIVFDRHTVEGRRVLNDIARDLHLPLAQLEWASFFFEGSTTFNELPSSWWNRHSEWHFRKVGLPRAEAHLVWDPVRQQVMDALAEESRKLQSELYKWKLANLEYIDALKRQVHLYIDHFDEIQKDQMSLF
jgi:hypothetical protein